MKSTAFFNNKGGVGKTTLLCNVAAFAALKHSKKVAVIDADPQCNATQYFFGDDEIEDIYDNSSFTINSVVEPLTFGEGFVHEIRLRTSSSFGLDVLCGDPKLALAEDFLAKEWGAVRSGDIRGMKTSLVFSDLLQRMEGYDLVFFDVSPSLGAINRSILLASDYFVSPMSIDIFSLKAFENISQWITGWTDDWRRGLENVTDKSKIPDLRAGRAQFLGYVTQQYLAKRDALGNTRGVRAYETIREKIDSVIIECGLNAGVPGEPFEIGTVPNLFSLIPMSQSNNKPVFELKSSDGVVGAHFDKVRSAGAIFGDVTKELLRRIDD